MEDATNWTQAAGLSDETLRPSHCADITSGHEDLNAHGLPLSNTFGLITCQDNKHASESALTNINVILVLFTYCYSRISLFLFF